ncbi:MAG TPA: D-2-hydroxyacid dehydrogenase [Longimicrobiales bacterium]|nr:D-2-hydroxyacid dehydrogenase [Longimicrobiales bacterium]
MRRVVFNMRDERPVWAPPPWVADRLRAALPADCELIEVDAPVTGRGDGGGVSAEAIAAVRGAEVYLGLGLPRELLHAALEPPALLRWVHSGAAGVASALHPELIDGDVVLTNSAGIHAAPMAETVIGMMLHFARGLDHAVRAQAETQWDTAIFEQRDSGVREVDGATLGIIGYGGIGRGVARRARALGMRVIATRRSDRPVDDAEILTGSNAVDRLLAQSDVVVLCVPSTPATRGMIGARELGLLRDDAILINVARGDVIDETALIDTLSAGRLRGAALDVFATEPLPQESALWRLPNVLITPHVSATSPRFWEREAELVLDNLRRYLAGEALRNVVDTAAGY